MNQPYITAILAITRLSFSTGAMAQDMSNSEYKAAEKNIEAEFESFMADCGSFSHSAKDICRVVAKRTEKVAKAELEARYKPSKRADYEVSFA
jgi:cob(I)alamin adenosyltransferase